MAGSPISQSAQYADEVLSRQILAPQVQFLIDGTSLALSSGTGKIYFTLPTRGRIRKIRALTQTALGGAQPVISIGSVGYYFTNTSATPGVFTCPGHPFAIGDPVVFSGATLSTGAAAGTTFWISAQNFVAGTSFSISTTYAYALAGTSAATSSQAGLGFVRPANAVISTANSLTSVAWKAHNLPIGTPVVPVTGTIATLSLGVAYWVSAYGYTANSFYLADTYAHAIAGTNTVSAGTGTVVMTPYNIVPNYGSTQVGDLSVYSYSDTGVNNSGLSAWVDGAGAALVAGPLSSPGAVIKATLGGGVVYPEDQLWAATVFSGGSQTGVVRVEVVVEPCF